MQGIGVYIQLAALPDRVIAYILQELQTVGADAYNITNLFLQVGKLDDIKAYRVEVKARSGNDWETVRVPLDDLTTAEQLFIDTLVKVRAAAAIKEL